VIKLYTATDLADATLLVDQLARSGVRARVRNAHLSSLAGELPFGQVLPEVWLERDGDAHAGSTILEDYVARKTLPIGEDRQCPECGEDNPANFELCWQCGECF
jgi:hypothetical protein